jgi:hypothetical protein
MAMRAAIKESIEVTYLPASSADYAGGLKASHPTLDVVWPDGVDASEIDDYWADAARTLATGASEDLDLQALANGPRSATVTFVEVRGLCIVAKATNTTTLTLAPGTANPWTALGAALSLDLEPGTYFRLFCAQDGKYPVTAGSKTLKVTNAAGASAEYAILVLGTLS